MNINPGLQKYSTEALYLKSPTTRKPFFGKPGSSHVLTTNGKTLVEIEVIYLSTHKKGLFISRNLFWVSKESFRRLGGFLLKCWVVIPGKTSYIALHAQRKAPSSLVPSFSVFFNLHSLIQSDFIIFISPLSLITPTLIDWSVALSDSHSLLTPKYTLWYSLSIGISEHASKLTL